VSWGRTVIRIGKGEQLTHCGEAKKKQQELSIEKPLKTGEKLK